MEMYFVEVSELWRSLQFDREWGKGRKMARRYQASHSRIRRSWWHYLYPSLFRFLGSSVRATVQVCHDVLRDLLVGVEVEP